MFLVIFPFDDHHNYSASDYKKHCEWSNCLRRDTIVTTEKDYVKLAAFSEDIPGNGKGWLVLGADHDFGRNRKELRAVYSARLKTVCLKKD